MFQSVWSDTVKLPEFEMLHGTAKTDVLIIGGGLCGILCAYFLEKAGIDYILVEGETIASGTTENTTAKITSQHGLIYDELLQTKGRELAGMYLKANQTAVEKYREMAQYISCEFEEKKAYVYSEWDREKLEAEVRAVNQLGFPAEYATDLPLPFDTMGAVCFPGQAQFHPLKFVGEIAKGLNIYEHTFVKEIDGHVARTDSAEITADKIICTTHFPFLNKRGSFFLKLYQSRSYVIGLENAAQVNGMYIDAAENGLSFRNAKDMLLFGGGGHRTGKSGGNWEMLRKLAAEYYPKSEERYCWAAQDCMSLDKVPYIGKYSGSTPWLYVASGFNKWGMTSSMVSAILLSDMVLDRENEWSQVFSPGRSMLKKQLLINIGESTAGLLTPTRKRCTHMGCSLKWNPQEHTWDCPCHGSRFEKDGTVIDNPAKRRAKLK